MYQQEDEQIACDTVFVCKDVKGSVNSCSLSLCRCNTKLSHTLA